MICDSLRKNIDWPLALAVTYSEETRKTEVLTKNGPLGTESQKVMS